MDENSVPFGKAISLIKEKFENDLTVIFKERSWKDALCFFEYHGPSSFAGNHNFEEAMTVTLIDVNPYKEGIMLPEEFIKYFGHLDIAKVLYEGYLSAELIDNVKQSTLNGMTFEGVVCKGANDKKTKMPIMFKIKSHAWLEKLKDYCKGDETLFNRLV